MTTNFGSARWSTATELAERGYADGVGIPLGAVAPPSLREAGRFLLMSPWWQSERACRMALFALSRQAMPVLSDNATHGVLFGSSVSGKTVSTILPLLLTCPDPMVVLDVKGELYQKSAAYRRAAFGHRIVALDPDLLVVRRSDALNPIGHIPLGSPTAMDDFMAVGDALVPRHEGSREPHFEEMAVILLTTLSAFVSSELPDANLQHVSTILSDPEALARMRVVGRRSSAFNGMLARLTGQVSHAVDREWASVLTTASRHLAFLNTAAVAACTQTSTFEPRWLGNPATPVTIYLVCPPEKLSSRAGLHRAWVVTLLRAVTQTGLKKDRRIRFVLDEAASLGKLESIEHAVTQLRSYGLRLFFVYQSMGQLKKVYGEGQDQTFLSNMDLQIHSGVNDYQTAEYVSNCLGKATVRNVTTSGGDQSGVNYDPHGMPTRSHSRNRGFSAQEGERHLLQPSEVMQLPERTCVVFAKGVPPFLTTQVRYYEPAFAAVLCPPTGRQVVRRSVGIGLLAGGLLALAAAAADAVPPTGATRPANEPAWPAVAPSPLKWLSPLDTAKAIDAQMRRNDLAAGAFKRAAAEARRRDPVGTPVPFEPVEWANVSGRVGGAK